MIFTQPYWVPTISCLYEMCAAGGGISKVYRLTLPFDPDEMICCCCKSFIFNYFLFTFKNNSIMMYPGFTVPEFVIESHLLNRN